MKCIRIIYLGVIPMKAKADKVAEIKQSVKVDCREERIESETKENETD